MKNLKLTLKQGDYLLDILNNKIENLEKNTVMYMDELKSQNKEIKELNQLYKKTYNLYYDKNGEFK